MKFPILVLLCLLGSLKAFSQVKAEFLKSLEEQKKLSTFKKDLILLDATIKHHPSASVIDSLKAKGHLPFLEVKSGQSHGNKSAPKQFLVHTDNEEMYNAYQDLKEAGKLHSLIQLPTLSVERPTNREPASTIVIPQKTNPHQSYNDFYLGVIKNVMHDNQSTLQPDGLTFAVYQSWEKDAQLASDPAIREYRLGFIIFLYKKYNF